MAYNYVNHGFLIEAYALDNDTGDQYDISDTIEDVMVRKRFIQDSFPLFVIDIRTTEEMRDILRDNNISIHLRISYYSVDENNDGTDTSDDNSVTELGVVYEGTIRIYEKPYPTTASKIEEESDEDEDQTTSTPFVYYQMSGIPEDLLEKNETSLNMVYKNCEIVDAAVHLISSIDTTSTVYMQETDNKDVFTDIFVPPLSLVPAISWLDTKYRCFYNHPSSFFLDSDEIYLYDPFSDEMPNRNTIEINVLSTEATGDTESIQRTMVDDDGNLKLTYLDLPSYSNIKNITGHTLGSQTIYYYYDENYNLVTREENDSTQYTKVRYVWEDLRVYTSEATKNGVGMSFALRSVNPALINPLTLVKIVSTEYPDAEGEYTINEMSYILSSSDNEHYSGIMTLSTFKRS